MEAPRCFNPCTNGSRSSRSELQIPQAASSGEGFLPGAGKPILIFLYPDEYPNRTNLV